MFTIPFRAVAWLFLLARSEFLRNGQNGTKRMTLDTIGLILLVNLNEVVQSGTKIGVESPCTNSGTSAR